VPPPSPVYNWGGIYFGFNLGYGFGTSNWSDSSDPRWDDRQFQSQGFPVRCHARRQFPDRLVHLWRRGGFRRLLYRRQDNPARFAAPLRNARLEIFGFSTLRARLGYAADRVLFYGTADGALGDVAPGLSGNFQRITKGGWTAGAGVEAVFTENPDTNALIL
jgi:outer membrane immunogenic protein